MLVDYFGKDHFPLIRYFEERGKAYPISKMSGNDCIRFGINLERTENNDKVSYYRHIEIFSIYNLDLRRYGSLEASLKDIVRRLSNNSHNEFDCIGYQRLSYTDSSVFLLNIFHTEQTDCYVLDKPKPQNSQASLLRLSLSNNEGDNNELVCNTLQQKVEEYCKTNNVLLNNIRLSLTRLFGFERLKFDISGLDKYIQFKNEVLSRCTEEELNGQAEKFINPHNYPRYFKNEVFAYSGAAIVKKIEEGRYSKIANNALNSLSPSSSLQPLQVLTLGAIGKSAGR